ncbi:proton-coupled zinc antiporter SLC30A2-like isoform X2 [Bolinopsis microptera]|uniref:proton-coupled zinc antiporter SLC30A2-like isoform X2 n=1 Tax=Bolinopsis microptera TaxID=2820187 RepID=UPI00307970AB
MPRRNDDLEPIIDDAEFTDFTELRDPVSVTTLPVTTEHSTLLPYSSYSPNSHGESGSESSDDHCHEIEEDKDNRNKARNQLMIASIVCLLFMVGEIVGGYIANSLAIMTDAAHMLSDFSSFCISLFALWVAKKPATRNMSLGWYRAEVMGAVSSVLIIWVLTGVLVYLAIQRMIHKEFEIDADTMLITAACGVLVNVVMGVLLHQGGHGHSHGGGGHGHSHGGGGHGHSHGATKTEQENINVRAAFIHVLGDLIQSLGVLVAAFLIKFNPTWSLADPICTLVFSVIVLFTTLTIMKDAVHVLMEGVPNNINYKMMEDDLKELSGVVAIHNLHVWSLTLDKSALAVHLAIDPNTSTQELLKEANRLLKKKYRISHCTIQIEFYQRAIMENCKKCQPPTK